MTKGCPLLPQNDTHPSMCVEGESHGRTFFLACLKDKCAAYKEGTCGVFGTEVDSDGGSKENPGRPE